MFYLYNHRWPSVCCWLNSPFFFGYIKKLNPSLEAFLLPGIHDTYMIYEELDYGRKGRREASPPDAGGIRMTGDMLTIQWERLLSLYISSMIVQMKWWRMLCSTVLTVTRGVYQYHNCDIFENIWVMWRYCKLSQFFVYVQLLQIRFSLDSNEMHLCFDNLIWIICYKNILICHIFSLPII